jgi:CubicO group peptidase (beta-lactamase class C family)
MSHPIAALLDARAAAGQEPGAALCVIRSGEVVVDHVVGTRDGVEPWTPDTLVMTYSVAKPFAALVVLDAVASGALGLDQPVADVWPEYAAHGKGATTVRQVLHHSAGLPRFPAAAADLAYDDLEGLTAALAAEPEFEPGSAVAEHALTYGHLCDALVRRATGGDDLADRFARIAADHGWDLHLRVAPSDLDRCADVVALDGWPDEYMSDPRWGPALSVPPGLMDLEVINSERFRRCSFPAVAMHASARGLARFYADLTSPDGPVATRLGPDLHTAYIGPQASGVDLVIGQEVIWTLGFQVDDEDLGMGGAGGCAAWWSLLDETAVGVVSRGLGSTIADAVWDALAAG